jgi:hypothetical protein
MKYIIIHIRRSSSNSKMKRRRREEEEAWNLLSSTLHKKHGVTAMAPCHVNQELSSSRKGVKKGRPLPTTTLEVEVEMVLVLVLVLVVVGAAAGGLI